MEDILASIRRIIADDDSAETTDVVVTEEPQPAEAPLSLTETVLSETLDTEAPLETIFDSELNEEGPVAASKQASETVETLASDNILSEEADEHDVLDLLNENLILDVVGDDTNLSEASLVDIPSPAPVEAEDDIDTILNELEVDMDADGVGDPLALHMDEDLVVPPTEVVQGPVDAANEAAEEAFTIDDLESIFDDADDDIILDELVIDPAASLLAEDPLIDTAQPTPEIGTHADNLTEDVSIIEDLLEGHDPTPALEDEALAANLSDSDLDDLIAEVEDEGVGTDGLTLEPLQEVELTASSESDLDLVKSLMADLTDDSFLEDGDQDMTPNEDVALQPVASNAAAESEADVMDDILDMTLEDEAALVETTPSDDGLSDIFAEIEGLGASETPEIQETAVETSSPKSLRDIAIAAQAEAESLDKTPAKPALGAALAAGAAAAVASTAVVASGNDTEEASDSLAETEHVEPDVDHDVAMSLDTDENPDMTSATQSDDTSTDNSPKENAVMARAKNAAKDTILDDVTESATASAFAELNSVVEEKAIVAERGDRIGDLVQEALRPMLKEWLDANLKGIVERAVTKEVKRIASGK